MGKRGGLESGLARTAKVVGAIVAIVGGVASVAANAQQHPLLVAIVLALLAECIAAYVYFSKGEYRGWPRRIALGALVALPVAAITVVTLWKVLAGLPSNSTIVAVAKFENHSSDVGDARTDVPFIGSDIADIISNVAASPAPSPRADAGPSSRLLHALRDRLAPLFGNDCGSISVCVDYAPQTVTPSANGGGYAKAADDLGRQHGAGIVVWGTYERVPTPDELIIEPCIKIRQSFRMDRAGPLSGNAECAGIANPTAQACATAGSMQRVVIWNFSAHSDRSDVESSLANTFRYVSEAIVGLARYDASDYPGSISALESAIGEQQGATTSVNALQPKLPIALDLLYYYLSDAYAKNGNNQAALDRIKKAVIKNGACAQNLTNQGMAEFNVADLSDAAKSYASALAKDPSNSVAAFNAAIIEEIYLGHYPQAYQMYADLATMAARRAWDWRYVGDAAERLGRYVVGGRELACSALHEAVRTEPHSSDAVALYADCRYHMGQFAAAIKQYDAALSWDPGNDGVRYSKGLAEAAAGEQGAARRDFERVRDDVNGTDEPTQGALLNAALAQQQLITTPSEIQDVEAAYTKAIRAGPASITALRQRSYLEAQLGQYAMAVSDLEAVVNDVPFSEGDLVNLAGVLAKEQSAKEKTHSSLIFGQILHFPAIAYKLDESRGDAELYRGDWRDAAAEYDKAIAANPYDAYAYLLRGYCEEKLGLAAATSDFKKAATLIPIDPTIDANAGDFRDFTKMHAIAQHYIDSGELYRRLGLSTEDNRIQE